jgi:hypothetical protein
LTEPVSALRTLVELPPSAPPPIEDLHRRVAARRRRRRVSQTALAGVAMALAGVAIVPLVERPSDGPTQVVAGLPEVGRAPAGGAVLVLQSDQDCAYLRWGDARAADPPVAGGCGGRTRDHAVQTFGPPVAVGDGLTAAILSGGPSMARYSARLADGRTVEGSLGAGGWAVVVADSRIVGVSGVDAQGLAVPEWIVR